MDHHSFRAQLLFSIGFALSRSRDLLRRLVREHAPDDARHELAEQVVKHLERSGFELDEHARALRQRPPGDAPFYTGLSGSTGLQARQLGPELPVSASWRARPHLLRRDGPTL